MPELKRPLKVFLCHAHSDKNAVREIYQRLIKDGVDAWLDKEKLLPGQDWELEIRRSVREADVVVVCLSKQFNQAGFRQKEVRLALDTAMEQPEGEIFIIPARLDDCDTLESLRKWHWVDLHTADGYENLMRALRTRADKIGATLRKRRRSQSARESLSPGSKKTEELPVESSKSKAEKPKSKRRKSWRRPNNTIMASIIGAVGVVLAAVISSPLWVNLLNTPESPSLTSLVSSPRATDVSSLIPKSTASHTVALTLSPTKLPVPTKTTTPEPGYEIVDPEEVLNIAPNLRTFGQLAIEKYSIEERNKMNNTLKFTVDSTADIPILWRWFWCAANDRILEQNMTKISIIFEADGRSIAEDQLATVVFENADPTYNGWKCRTYETVLRNWKHGTYKFIQTMTIASDINDGDKRYEAGIKTYEYIVNISP